MVDEWTIIILRMLRFTFDHGISGFAAVAFAHFAGVIGSKHQLLALRLARLARQILKITNAKHLEYQKGLVG